MASVGVGHNGRRPQPALDSSSLGLVVVMAAAEVMVAVVVRTHKDRNIVRPRWHNCCTDSAGCTSLFWLDSAFPITIPL